MTKNISQELIKAFSRINKYGKSEITIDTYIRYICLNREIMNRLYRNLTFAELMSRLASIRDMDEWYIAGLLNDIGELNIPSLVKSPAIVPVLLAKANINSGLIHAVTSYKKIDNPQQWTPLITALIFADSHITSSGLLLTTEECCREKTTDTGCGECIYSRFIFRQNGTDKRAEAIIRKLQEDLTGREEVEDGIQRQRCVEERGPASNALYAG